jgi:tRNA(Ile)-lysidine synthase TilS/MesJ
VQEELVVDDQLLARVALIRDVRYRPEEVEMDFVFLEGLPHKIVNDRYQRLNRLRHRRRLESAEIRDRPGERLQLLRRFQELRLVRVVENDVADDRLVQEQVSKNQIGAGLPVDGRFSRYVRQAPHRLREDLWILVFEELQEKLVDVFIVDQGPHVDADHVGHRSEAVDDYLRVRAVRPELLQHVDDPRVDHYLDRWVLDD